MQDGFWLLARHGFWLLARANILYHAMLNPSWSFPRTTNFEMRSVQRRNPRRWLSTKWTWIPRVGLMRKKKRRILTVHPDCAVDNAVLLCLTHHTTRDYVARGYPTDEVKCDMTDGRGSISPDANRFPWGENFALDCPGCPRIEVHVRRWSRLGYREGRLIAGRMRDYIITLCTTERNVCRGF